MGEVKILLVDYYFPNKEYIDIVEKTNNNKYLVFRLGKIDNSIQDKVDSCNNKQEEINKVFKKLTGNITDNLLNLYNERNRK